MSKIPQLGITCGATNCAQDKHAFNNPLKTYKRRGQGRQFLQPGVCKGCGADLIDWARLHGKNPADIEYTIEALKREYIRWEFWNRSFSDKARADLNERGIESVYADIRPTLVRIVLPKSQGYWMNMAVPTEQEKLTSVIQYGQHAIAACCRKCVETWHGIRNDRALTDSEIDYLVQLLSKYLDLRLSDNSDNPSLKERRGD
jgi:hypothetical protein